jgi:hypothetical protein
VRICGIRNVPLARRIRIRLDTGQVSFKRDPAVVLFASILINEQGAGELDWLRRPR